MNKIGIYTQWNTTQSQKKNEIFAICSNMDGLGEHYAKLNKSKKDRHCMISLICGIKKNELMN